MNYKRETSTTVSDLHLNSMADSIKRLAISKDGYPEYAAGSSANYSSNEDMPTGPALPHPSAVGPRRTNGIVTVTSTAKDDFNSKYDIVREIGRGGFSIVYQCRDRSSQVDYAVKIIDLRPLKLRERFNPARLRREVDIMRRLSHPNIIQFVEVYEDPDHLMMVMEYFSGDELFDVILARKYFSEDDAKPIFQQIVKALFYLHSLNIIHRDVKPENVLISHSADPATGMVVAKLLDFGLSKNAGAGSAAKTFVGTPCYVAPEVEYTSKGLGGTYGFPADCWSLGALLYVMLVARFPEFEQNNVGKIVLKLPPVLWNNVSGEAKDLIRSLMNTNPSERATMGSVLLHPWLGQYRCTNDDLLRWTTATRQLSTLLREEEARMEVYQRANINSSIVPQGSSKVQLHNSQTMVVRSARPPDSMSADLDQQLQIAPLLHLQRSVATCFAEVHASYQHLPDVAYEVRQGAILCRQQLLESTKMLRRVEHTSGVVLNMLPDLELAIEEGEPKLAGNFFSMVKGWVVELKELVISTQSMNKQSMDKIQQIIERSTIGLQAGASKAAVTTHSVNIPKPILEAIMKKLEISDKLPVVDNDNAMATSADDTLQLSVQHLMELFASLFSNASPSKEVVESSSLLGRIYSIDSDASLGGGSTSPDKLKTEASDGHAEASGNGFVDTEAVSEQTKAGIIAATSHRASNMDVDYYPVLDSRKASNDSTISMDGGDAGRCSDSEDPSKKTQEQEEHTPLVFVADGGAALKPTQPPVSGASHLNLALEKLHQVDVILEELSVFWANTETVLDLLTKKGQHVEQFIEFASKPRLMTRFKDRMDEYKRFWEGVSRMCSNYVAGVQQSTNNNNDSSQRMYCFLDNDLQQYQGGPSATNK